MKIKIGELVGPSLDWAVAKALGWKLKNCGVAGVGWFSQSGVCEDGEPALIYFKGWVENTRPFSTDWSQGGPIIEREEIDIYCTESKSTWEAEIQIAPKKRAIGKGSTPLVAAMRCYVASKVGDEIDIPDELLKST